MKNAEIILEERLRLMDEGKIKSTEKKIPYKLKSGVTIEIPEPEEIHTKNIWEKLGYKIKEGEDPITHLKIWKPYKSHNAQGVVKTLAAFYSMQQVERVEE